MRNIFIVFSFVFFTEIVQAHQSNISTTMLVEKENNTWVLQIRASLTAYQQEIKAHFSETPYKTPEEFKEMVLVHLQNNLSIIINGDNQIILKKGYVKLGHETNVIFELENIPNNINKLEITNAAFNDIYKSKNALVILKEGFSKKRFILDENNKYKMLLETEGNVFIDSSKEINKKDTNLYVFFFLLIIFIVISFFLNKYQQKKMSII